MPLPKGYSLDPSSNLPPGYKIDQAPSMELLPETPESPGYFKEALAAGGRVISGLASIPRQLLTPHETLGATREEEVKMGPTGRLLYNIPADIGQSLIASEAARQASARQGEGIPGQALSYLESSIAGPVVKKAEEAGPGKAKFTPQTLGAIVEGVGYLEAPKAATEVVAPGLSKVGELRKGFEEKAQSAARSLTEVKTGVKKGVTSAIEKQKTVEEANKAITEQNIAKQKQVERRGKLAKTVDQQSADLGKKIENVESKVYKAADEKFNAVRQKIGNAETKPDDLIASVQSAEKNILQEIPENIKEFRSILKMQPEEMELVVGGEKINPGDPGYEAVKQAYEAEGMLPENKPVTWDKLQSLKSRLDKRLRSRTPMNGDVKRALFSVRNSVVDEMGKMAEANGAKAEWATARDFWRQMREDFHEPTGPSGSGSPVAQAFNATDPKAIRQPFLRTQSTLGNRGVDTLRKYGEYGGNEAADLAEKMLQNHEAALGLPTSVSPKPLKTPPSNVVDLDAIARNEIANTASRVGRLNAWDFRIIASSMIAGVLSPFIGIKGGTELGASYVATKYFLANALNKPKVIDWIARTPQAEIDSLNQLPGIDKVNVQTGITQAAIQTGTKRISPQLQRFLGPQNVARIISATGAVAGANQPVQNRKEALESLGR